MRSHKLCCTTTTWGTINLSRANKLSGPFLATQQSSEDGAVIEQAIAAASCFGLWKASILRGHIAIVACQHSPKFILTTYKNQIPKKEAYARYRRWTELVPIALLRMAVATSHLCAAGPQRKLQKGMGRRGSLPSDQSPSGSAVGTLVQLISDIEKKNYSELKG